MENDPFWNEIQEQLEKKKGKLAILNQVSTGNTTLNGIKAKQSGEEKETETKAEDGKNEDEKQNSKEKEKDKETNTNDQLPRAERFARWFRNALGKFILLGTFLFKQAKTFKFWRNLFILTLSI